MNSAPPESREVPVDVLPPLPADAHAVTGHATRIETTHRVGPVAPLSGWRSFYHPASGLVILGIDLLLFGPELLSGFLATPVMCVLAFLATFPLVYLIQWKWSGNTRPAAFGKAFLGAFLAGLPFSITGTIFGAAVLALSGLPHNPLDALKKILSPARKLAE